MAQKKILTIWDEAEIPSFLCVTDGLTCPPAGTPESALKKMSEANVSNRYAPSFKYYFFFSLHCIALIAWYSSPLWLDWRIVISTVIVYHLQIYFWQACLLTTGQFGNKEEGFYEHYLRKLGFRPNIKKLNFVLSYVIPGIMIVIAIVRQVIIPIWSK